MDTEMMQAASGALPVVVFDWHTVSTVSVGVDDTAFFKTLFDRLPACISAFMFSLVKLR
jgi:hypothetical protein